MGSTVWYRMRKEKRQRVTKKFEDLKHLVQFVATWHSDHNVRRIAGCEVLRQNDYIKMASTNPNVSQNTINEDILKRCNKIHKQYLLLKEECK